jgi:enterochelin esterase family protein
MGDSGFCTTVDGDVVVVRYPDPDGDAESVRLWSEIELDEPTLVRVEQGWELRLHDLPVDRLEYLLEVDGDQQLDPTNPQTVDGAFGEHSWVALPSYGPPAWLSEPEIPSKQVDLLVEGTAAGDIDATLWAPADADPAEPLPLLVVHDGPEMAMYGELLTWAGAGIAAGRLPRLRVALLSPGARNERYSANPAYASALSADVLPVLRETAAVKQRPVLVGQSLGGLAALHAAWTSPGTFAGLMLQSGSFFTPELDPQESDFEYWDEVTGFVATVLAATQAAPDAPSVAMTCGTAEENLANNLLVRDHLISVGLDVTWGEVRQAHTWTCWRDVLDPHLTQLVRKVWT